MFHFKKPENEEVRSGSEEKHGDFDGAHNNTIKKTNLNRFRGNNVKKIIINKEINKIFNFSL